MSFRIYSTVQQTGPVIAATVLLIGCSAMHADITLKEGESVAVLVSEDVGWPGPFNPLGWGPEQLSIGRVRVLNESTSASGTEVRTGAGAGAVGGAAVGLLCGPLAPFCMPMGALKGAEVGALGGLVVGSASALPTETAERLRDRVERALQSHDLRAQIKSNVVAGMHGHWHLDSDRPTATVEIRLQEFALTASRDQRVRCSFKVNVAVREQRAQQSWAGRQPPPADQRRLYEYVCPYEDLARWLDESQGLVEANLAAAGQHLAGEIVSGLAGTR